MRDAGAENTERTIGEKFLNFIEKMMILNSFREKFWDEGVIVNQDFPYKTTSLPITESKRTSLSK